jgi:hypothetical protein
MCLGLASVLASFGKARADTGGNAAACVPYSGRDSTGPLYFELEGADNLSGTTGVTYVTCGTLRLTSSSPPSLYVDYEDGTTNDGVTCTVAVMTWGGDSTLWSQTQQSSVSFTGGSYFNFAIPTSAVGYINILCRIPAAGTYISDLSGFNLQ